MQDVVALNRDDTTNVGDPNVMGYCSLSLGTSSADSSISFIPMNDLNLPKRERNKKRFLLKFVAFPAKI